MRTQGLIQGGPGEGEVGRMGKGLSECADIETVAEVLSLHGDTKPRARLLQPPQP